MERKRWAHKSGKPLADLRIQILRMFFGEQLMLVQVGGEKTRGSVAGAVACRKARQATVFNGFDLLPYPHGQLALQIASEEDAKK